MSISYNLYLTQMNSSVKRVTRCKQHNYANTFRVSYFEKKTACLIGSLWGPSVCSSVNSFYLLFYGLNNLIEFHTFEFSLSGMKPFQWQVTAFICTLQRGKFVRYATPFSIFPDFSGHFVLSDGTHRLLSWCHSEEMNILINNNLFPYVRIEPMTDAFVATAS